MSHYKRNWLTKRDIYRKPGELYLTRYVLFRCQFFGIYVHKFWISDYEVPHDHPWNFISIPILAGYKEHLPDGTWLERGSFNVKFRTAEEFHWVELNNGPAWTVFIHFRKRRKWGFLTKGGWVDASTYNERMGMLPDGEQM